MILTTGAGPALSAQEPDEPEPKHEPEYLPASVRPWVELPEAVRQKVAEQRQASAEAKATALVADPPALPDQEGDGPQAAAEPAQETDEGDGSFPKFTPPEPVRAEPEPLPEPAPDPLPPTFPPSSAKVGGSGLQKKVGGSGVIKDEWFEYPCPLPEPDSIQWERRTDKRGWVAQFAPKGKRAPRNTKTRLGWAGVRQTAEWMQLSAREREKVVRRWLAERRAEKGL